MADNVVLISEGRVQFTGTPAELAGSSTVEARFRDLTKGVVA